MTVSPVTIARFWDKVEKKELTEKQQLQSNIFVTGCWEWKASFVTGGYGYFRYSKKHGMAHRFSYELHYGPIPEGRLVCHICDNPKCVNPGHLFLGSIKDNTVHAAQNGLMPRGSDVNTAKLVEEQVDELKTLFSQGWSIHKLSKFYGIHWINVQKILKGVSWKYHPMKTSIDIRSS